MDPKTEAVSKALSDALLKENFDLPCVEVFCNVKVVYRRAFENTASTISCKIIGDIIRLQTGPAGCNDQLT